MRWGNIVNFVLRLEFNLLLGIFMCLHHPIQTYTTPSFSLCQFKILCFIFCLLHFLFMLSFITLKFWGSLPGGSETVLASVGVRWLLELPLDKKRKNVIRTRGNYSNKVQELYIISVKLGDTWCSMEKCWKRMKSWGSSWCNLKRI
jgi:hypothetical protein